MSSRAERETVLTFADEDLLGDGDARLYTFRRSLVDKALRAGGRIVLEHRRGGRIEAWDVAVPAKLVRIGFKRRAGAKDVPSPKLARNPPEMRLPAQERPCQ